MIWKSEHIRSSAKSSSEDLKKCFIQSRNSSPLKTAFAVGIIGGGPKGMYSLEEMLRQYSKHRNLDKLCIYWWNETEHFGSGPNYQVDQGDFLLINYCIGHIDAWDRTDPNGYIHLNFMQWIEKNITVDCEVKPTDYASRALVGHYLQNTLLKIIHSKPLNIDIILIPERVDTIHRSSKMRFQVESKHHKIDIDNVVLTTGHCYQNKALINNNKGDLPERYIPSAYPIKRLDHISPKDNVGIIGWGLTFIDVALALTEGRGGRFDERFNYIPSGKEPTLIPFSRNQLPIMPRGPIYGTNTYKLKYINEKWVESLENSSKDKKIDFIEDIFPMLEKELKYAYYSTLLKTRNENKIVDYIQKLPKDEVFSYQKFLYPVINKNDKIQKSYINYIEKLIKEAEKGELKSPLMAAAAVWREASNIVSKVYAFGGLTGKSQEILDKKLFSAFCRTSYGPPIENMKKIVALMKSGIIKTFWTQAIEWSYDEEGKYFILENETHQEKVNWMVDARIARPDLQGNNNFLFQNLKENKLVQSFVNQGYQPGIAAMNVVGKVIHSENIPMFFYGSNTEGALLDNDSLSRKKNNLAPLWATEVIKQMTSVKNNPHK